MFGKKQKKTEKKDVSSKSTSAGFTNKTQKTSSQPIRDTSKQTEGSNYSGRVLYSQSMPEVGHMIRSRKQSEKKRRGKDIGSSSKGPLEAENGNQSQKENEESDNCSYSEGEELDRPASVAAEELFDHDEELMFLEETISQNCTVTTDDETLAEEPQDDTYPVDEYDECSQNVRNKSRDEGGSPATSDPERNIRAGSIPYLGAENIDTTYLFLLLHRFQEVRILFDRHLSHSS